MTKRLFCIYWLPVIIYAILILCLSSISELPPSPYQIPHLDKLLHLIEYAGFGFLLARALKFHRCSKFYILTILVCFVYALLDESYQSLFPARENSIYDVIFDVIGAFLGAAILKK